MIKTTASTFAQLTNRTAEDFGLNGDTEVTVWADRAQVYLADIASVDVILDGPECEAAYASLLDGERVEGGDTAEDYDTGTVVEVDGVMVTVAWDSGVRTTQRASLLRAA